MNIRLTTPDVHRLIAIVRIAAAQAKGYDKAVKLELLESLYSEMAAQEDAGG